MSLLKLLELFITFFYYYYFSYTEKYNILLLQ